MATVVLEEPLIGEEEGWGEDEEENDGDHEAAFAKGVLTGGEATGGEASAPEALAFYGEQGVVVSAEETSSVDWSSGIFDCCEAPTSRCLYVRVDVVLHGLLSPGCVRYDALVGRYSTLRSAAGLVVPVLHVCGHCRAGTWI